MFVVNNPNRSIAPLQGSKTQEAPATREAEATGTPATPTPFAQSTFEPPKAAPVNLGGAAPPAYWPTNAELTRPTTAAVVNITNGERQPLNPGQMSSEQQVAFAQDRLRTLGFGGSLTATNTTSPTTGPFRIDYGNDDRRHWDIGGLNVALVANLYANNPPHVADAMLRADMQHARSGPAPWEEEGTPRIPANVTASGPAGVAAQSGLPPNFRILPGTSASAPSPHAAAQGSTPPYFPTVADLDRPTTAASVNILDGSRTGLNPAQLSEQQGVDFVLARLRDAGYQGPGKVSNQTAPTTGPFGIDYGNDTRRHWDIDGMNVGLTLRMYANNPREVADRMLADLLRNQMPRPNDD